MTFTLIFHGVLLVCCSSSYCVVAAESDWLSLSVNVQVNLLQEFVALFLFQSGKLFWSLFSGLLLSSQSFISLPQQLMSQPNQVELMMSSHQLLIMEMKNLFIFTTLFSELFGLMHFSKPLVSLSSPHHVPCGIILMDQDKNSIHPSSEVTKWFSDIIWEVLPSDH